MTWLPSLHHHYSLFHLFPLFCSYISSFPFFPLLFFSFPLSSSFSFSLSSFFSFPLPFANFFPLRQSILNSLYFCSRLERSTDQVIKPINLEALSKWVGQIPEDVVKDMGSIAPMLETLGYDPNANPPNYGKPDSFVVDKMKDLEENKLLWQKKELEMLKQRESIRNLVLKEKEESGIKESKDNDSNNGINNDIDTNGNNNNNDENGNNNNNGDSPLDHDTWWPTRTMFHRLARKNFSSSHHQRSVIKFIKEWFLASFHSCSGSREENRKQNDEKNGCKIEESIQILIQLTFQNSTCWAPTSTILPYHQSLLIVMTMVFIVIRFLIFPILCSSSPGLNEERFHSSSSLSLSHSMNSLSRHFCSLHKLGILTSKLLLNVFVSLHSIWNLEWRGWSLNENHDFKMNVI